MLLEGLAVFQGCVAVLTAFGLMVPGGGGRPPPPPGQGRGYWSGSTWQVVRDAEVAAKARPPAADPKARPPAVDPNVVIAKMVAAAQQPMAKLPAPLPVGLITKATVPEAKKLRPEISPASSSGQQPQVPEVKPPPSRPAASSASGQQPQVPVAKPPPSRPAASSASSSSWAPVQTLDVAMSGACSCSRITDCDPIATRLRPDCDPIATRLRPEIATDFHRFASVATKAEPGQR
jgi:hypothetical protein